MCREVMMEITSVVPYIRTYDVRFCAENVKMKLLACVLLALLPSMMLGEVMECPEKTVMENFDFNRFQGDWYVIRRTGVPDDSKCQQHIIRAENDTTSTITFKYADLNETRYSLVTHEGILWKTDSSGKLLFTVPSIFPGRESAYWVLDTDYDKYAVIYTCYVFKNKNHRSYVTVLSRTTSMPETATTAINSVLEANNHVADQMLRVSHYSCPTE